MSQEHSASRATALRDAQVGDVMSAPLVSCFPSVPLWEVAELMTRHRIHAVVVLAGPSGLGEDDEWGVISELDLVGGACLADPEVPAGRLAATPSVVVGPDESLERAAMLMAEYQVTHLIAVEERRAVGIVSALDLAGALAPAVAGREEGPGGGAASVLAGAPGDRLVISAHHLGGQERDAEILETRGPEGRPPFLVRWQDSGRESLLYPGSDAHIQRLRR